MHGLGIEPRNHRGCALKAHEFDRFSIRASIYTD